MMELRDLWKVFFRHRTIFFATIFGVMALAFAARALMPSFVSSDVALNVTRSGAEETAEYQYHDFYRLQADERFADTVVRWIASPQMQNGISESAGFPVRSLKARRLSSQMIRVTYDASDISSAKALARALIDRINEESRSLNQSAKEKAWFEVIGSEPFVKDGRPSLSSVAAASFFLGVFSGMWAVFLRHYCFDLEKRKEKEE